MAIGQLIMDCGSLNNRSHFDITGIVTTLEFIQPELTVAALPGFHTLLQGVTKQPFSVGKERSSH